MNNQLEIELPFEYQNSDGYKKALETYHYHEQKGWEPHLCYSVATKTFFATLFSTKESIEKYSKIKIVK